jgi:hypothetical protein
MIIPISAERSGALEGGKGFVCMPARHPRLLIKHQHGLLLEFNQPKLEKVSLQQMIFVMA